MEARAGGVNADRKAAGLLSAINEASHIVEACCKEAPRLACVFPLGDVADGVASDGRDEG